MNNKSAFPVFDSRNAGQDYECIDAGMTLRDYFAIHCSSDDYRQFIPDTVGGIADLMVSLGWIPKSARDADVLRCYSDRHKRRLTAWARYQYADLMISERGEQ